jgi:hypothetical protein
MPAKTKPTIAELQAEIDQHLLECSALLKRTGAGPCGLTPLADGRLAAMLRALRAAQAMRQYMWRDVSAADPAPEAAKAKFDAAMKGVVLPDA